MNATEAFRGQTALMWAAAENHEAVARLLIELGADVNVRSTHYEFPALTGGNGGIIHDRAEGGLTALMFAARQGSIETTDRLLAAGADINASEPQYGFTPLQTAIFNGHYELASRLAEKGANVNDGSLYTAIETRNLATYSNRPNPPDTDNGVTSLDLIKRSWRAARTRTCRTRRGFRRVRRRATSTSRRAPRRSIAPREPPISRPFARCSTRAPTRTWRPKTARRR